MFSINRMDVNEQFRATKLRFRLVFSIFQAKNHFLDASRCSTWGTLCYHLKGATPLMLSILARFFPAADVLLEAGATLDLKNCRQKTAFDLAVETQAPYLLVKRMAANGALTKALSINVLRFQRKEAEELSQEPAAETEMQQDLQSQLKEATLSFAFWNETGLFVSPWGSHSQNGSVLFCCFLQSSSIWVQWDPTSPASMFEKPELSCKEYPLVGGHSTSFNHSSSMCWTLLYYFLDIPRLW